MLVVQFGTHHHLATVEVDEAQPPGRAGIRLRADAQRNRDKVLEAARRAFAARGFGASYHDIARLAGVGVGTVYRRYPDRPVLVEAVLLDILGALAAKAEAASVAEDAWSAFSAFFVDLSVEVRQHAGLSGQLQGHGSEQVERARQRLLDAIEQLRRRALTAGLRPDLGWEDILFLAQVAAAEGCGFDLIVDDTHRDRARSVILDGLRSVPRTGCLGSDALGQAW